MEPNILDRFQWPNICEYAFARGIWKGRLRPFLQRHYDNDYKDFTYNDFTYNDFTCNDFTCNDFTYNNFTYNINKCVITYKFFNCYM